MLTPLRLQYARFLLSVCVGTSILAFSVRGFAQDGEAATLIDTGIERYKKHDYEAARFLFGRAHEIDPSETGILFNLALAELQSGHPVDAAKHFRTFIGSPQAQLERRESARTKWLPEAESQIGQLSISAPTGAVVSIDGTAVGATPFEQPVYVTPGDHEVRAKLASGEPALRITATAGSVVVARFEPEPPAPPPAPVRASPASLPKPAMPERAPPTPGTAPSLAKIFTVAGLAVSAGVAAGAGVAVAIDTQSKHNQYEALSCDAGPSPSSNATCGRLSQNGQTEGVVANVLYVGGGVLAAGALATLILWPNAPAKSSWVLRPTFDPRSASAIVQGSF
jgi:hypothetical protein